MWGDLNLRMEGLLPRQRKMKMASTAGEDIVLAEDGYGMKASVVPNQALVLQCFLVTLRDSVLAVFFSYISRQLCHGYGIQVCCTWYF